MRIPKMLQVMEITSADHVREYIRLSGADPDKVVLFDNFYEAFVGVSVTYHEREPRAVYSLWKMIDKLMNEGHEYNKAMSIVERIYAFDYGAATPVIMEVVDSIVNED